MKGTATVIKTLLTASLVIIVGVLALVWSGLYPVAAGSGHTGPVAWLLETVRERSVAVRARDLVMPDDLDSQERIAAGAGHYKSMCAACHGRPGQAPADAFGPAPPALYEYRVDAAEAFWTIKHGLKMTAMPSHLDHSDAENWDTVAFVRALPEMDATEYETMAAEASHDHGVAGGHEHGSDGGGHHDDESGREGRHGDAAMDGASDEADSPGPGHEHAMGASTPRATVEGFRHALAEGRGDDALPYLHPGATIVEGGHVQTVGEYAAGHLGSDMEFLRAIEIDTLSQTVHSGGGQATVETRSRFTGEIDGEPLDLESTEFATLVQTDEGWRISQVAWSARPFGEDDAEDPNHEHDSGEDNHDH